MYKVTGVGNLGFRLMSFAFRWLKNPAMVGRMLEAVGVTEGQSILDYACGPGKFTIAAAKLVGQTGHIYAADMQPLARTYIEKQARKDHVTNITVLITDSNLDIPDETVDVILLFDVIHYLKNQDAVFRELHRVLRQAGILAVDVYYDTPTAAQQTVENSQLFELAIEREIHEKHSNGLLLFAKSSP